MFMICNKSINQFQKLIVIYLAESKTFYVTDYNR